MSAADDTLKQGNVVDQVRRAIRARMHFKAIVRLAHANRAWLLAPEVVPKKKKLRQRQLHRITLADKAILNKNPIYRTAVEKERIYTIISFIKSIRKYPESIVRQLAGVTYFAYFEANRMIVRQSHPAKAMYFIIKGDCESQHFEYNKEFDENVEINSFQLHAGESFGDYGLLHHVARVSTITTITACEFLYLKADDFDEILRDLVTRDWHIIMDCLDKFTYFKEWDDITRREFCMVTKRVKFQRGETVLGKSENESDLPKVFFILNGQCDLIEFLLVHEDMVNGILKQSFFSAKEEDALLETRRLSTVAVTNAPSTKWVRLHSLISMSKKQRFMERIKQLDEEDYGTDDDYVDSDSNIHTRDSKMKSIPKYSFHPADLKTYFVKICSYNSLACFNIGENMRRRCIVAITDMECMVVPRYWLMAHGWTKHWSLVRNYLNRQIPTSEQVYKEFMEKRKFRNFTKDFVSSLPHKRPCNCPGNVPYSIRVGKDFNYDYDD